MRRARERPHAWSRHSVVQTTQSQDAVTANAPAARRWSPLARLVVGSRRARDVHRTLSRGFATAIGRLATVARGRGVDRRPTLWLALDGPAQSPASERPSVRASDGGGAPRRSSAAAARLARLRRAGCGVTILRPDEARGCRQCSTYCASAAAAASSLRRPPALNRAGAPDNCSYARRARASRHRYRRPRWATAFRTPCYGFHEHGARRAPRPFRHGAASMAEGEAPRDPPDRLQSAPVCRG